MQIRVPEVRLIDDEGGQVGVVKREEAYRMAQDKGLDLVEVSPNAKPPVCKIIDYGKYKYLQQKKQQENKKNQTVVTTKEIKMRPNIDQHDFDFKMRHVQRFLEDKDKVKITVRLRGREMAHADRGADVLERAFKVVEEIASIDSAIKREGRNFSMIVAPKKAKG